MRRACYFVVFALVLGACGSDDAESGREDLERGLIRTVEEQTGTRDVKVDCPEEGDVCSVTAPGGVRSKVTVDGEVLQP